MWEVEVPEGNLTGESNKHAYTLTELLPFWMPWTV
jgi:hypothetical protein